MLCSLATKLGQDDLTQIGDLEKELGITLLAFSCHSLDPAAIDDGRLTRVKELEERLGISLVAVAA
jgi:hypothetical protein